MYSWLVTHVKSAVSSLSDDTSVFLKTNVCKISFDV